MFHLNTYLDHFLKVGKMRFLVSPFSRIYIGWTMEAGNSTAKSFSFAARKNGIL